MKTKRQPKVVRVQRGKTTAANLEARFDAGKDVSDYFNKLKVERIKRRTLPDRKGSSAWEALGGVASLNVEIPEMFGSVQKIEIPPMEIAANSAKKKPRK